MLAAGRLLTEFAEPAEADGQCSTIVHRIETAACLSARDRLANAGEFDQPAAYTQVKEHMTAVCKPVASTLPATAGPRTNHILPNRAGLRAGMADMGAVRDIRT
jgi:hypothetical protein